MRFIPDYVCYFAPRGMGEWLDANLVQSVDYHWEKDTTTDTRELFIYKAEDAIAFRLIFNVQCV